MNFSTLEQARTAKAQALQTFEKLGEVVGLGITRIGEGFGLKVNLRASPTDVWPTNVDGVPVEIEIVGTIRKRTPSGA